MSGISVGTGNTRMSATRPGILARWRGLTQYRTVSISVSWPVVSCDSENKVPCDRIWVHGVDAVQIQDVRKPGLIRETVHNSDIRITALRDVIPGQTGCRDDIPWIWARPRNQGKTLDVEKSKAINKQGYTWYKISMSGNLKQEAVYLETRLTMRKINISRNWEIENVLNRA